MNIRFIKHSIINGARQFLENIPKVFQANKQSKKEERLERENQKLKTMVGELTMELKKRLVKFQRRRSSAMEASDRTVLTIIRRLKAEHPFWG